ncbi:hypothetical protein MKW92_011925, partial [Papaver armeniacum]
MPPLLHFHLKHPIKVGKEKTKDIEFRLVSTPVGQRRADNDSNKIENEKKTRDWERNMDLEDFVDRVQDKWRTGPFQFDPFNFDNLDKTDEFRGFFFPL